MLAYQGLSSLWNLQRACRGADGLLVWFAGRHAPAAMALGRWVRIPIALIVGGYEAAWIPEISYGVPPRSMRAHVLRRLLRMADLVLPVSDVTERGLEALGAGVERSTRRVYNAIDTGVFKFDAGSPRRGVLCVGSFNRETLAVKGWRLFWKVAAHFPDVPFVAVGPATDRAGREFVSDRPPNLTWLGESTGEPLLRQFQMARVYFQGSVHESFGVAVAEAMACGCIPVLSRRGALPEVAGDAAIYMDDLTAESAQAAVREALQSPESRRLAARQRIVEHFDIGRRRNELTAALREMIQSAKG